MFHSKAFDRTSAPCTVDLASPALPPFAMRKDLLGNAAQSRTAH